MDIELVIVGCYLAGMEDSDVDPLAESVECRWPEDTGSAYWYSLLLLGLLARGDITIHAFRIALDDHDLMDTLVADAIRSIGWDKDSEALEELSDSSPGLHSVISL